MRWEKETGRRNAGRCENGLSFDEDNNDISRVPFFFVIIFNITCYFRSLSYRITAAINSMKREQYQ